MNYRTILFLLCTTGYVTAQQPGEGGAFYQTDCNYITLVKCFIDILDDWAWTLYELRDNVVTITSEQCQHLQQLDKCVKDDIDRDQVPGLGEHELKHQCKHDEIVEVSNTVSDLLTHRKKSGSFLKSYFLLTYACTEEGQAILRDHRECLKEEEIGQMTLSAGTYMSEKFLTHADDEVCDQVNHQLDEYMQSTRKLCKQEAAARLMCKSLINMFKGLHADKLESCELHCNIPPSDDEKPEESNDLPEGEVQPAIAGDSHALTPASSASVLSTVLAIFVPILLR